MRPHTLLADLRRRGVKLILEGIALRCRGPKGVLTPDLLAEIGARKAALLVELALVRIDASWKPGERIAYRDEGRLVTAKFAGVSTCSAVNVWLADGALRAIPPESVALDWHPYVAEEFEERLSIMIAAGVPEDEARVRAEVCTREYLDRFRGGAA